MNESAAPKSGFPAPMPAGQIDHNRSELLAKAAEVIDSGSLADDWDALSHYAVPGWYLDAKFGIFIHWIPGAVGDCGEDWYPRNLYIPGTDEHAHHARTFGPQESVGFKDLLHRFSGEKFDADEWMNLIKLSGARYVMPVAEHHDGFALYNTALSRWSSLKIGPGRDVVGELAAAARARGLAFGVSSHRAEHWWFFNSGRHAPSDVLGDEFADLYGPAQPRHTQPDVAFLDDWLASCVELVELYDPDIVWFDWWIEQPAFNDYLRRFAAYRYNRRPDGTSVINYKWSAFADGSAVRDVERGAVDRIQDSFFQNDTSTSRVSWSYLTHNEYKPLTELIVDLADTVSKNGCLLLNIGPKPDGTIGDEDKELLLGMGQWLAVNGEAIYSSRPWLVYGEGPTELPTGSFADTEATAWTSHDMRFTRVGSDIYAIVFDWPRDRVAKIKSLGTDLRLVGLDVLEVHLLGHQNPLRWRRGSTCLEVILPDIRDNGLPFVLKVSAEEWPEPERFEPPIVD